MYNLVRSTADTVRWAIYPIGSSGPPRALRSQPLLPRFAASIVRGCGLPGAHRRSVLVYSEGVPVLQALPCPAFRGTAVDDLIGSLEHGTEKARFGAARKKIISTTNTLMLNDDRSRFGLFSPKRPKPLLTSNRSYRKTMSSPLVNGVSIERRAEIVWCGHRC
jgi:hypothetical protein